MLGLLGVFAGSPNSPRATIVTTSRQDPGGAALAFTQELAGTSASAGNQNEFGLGPPGELFVTGPLASFAPLLGSNVTAALAAWRAAPASQQAAWANNYLMALDKITPAAMEGGMETAMSPDYSKIGTLHGDFGPVPTLVKADVRLAQSGTWSSGIPTSKAAANPATMAASARSQARRRGFWSGHSQRSWLLSRGGCGT